MNKVQEPEFPPIGKNLKHERLARHLSLGALAENSGISKAMLSQIESGRVNPTLVTLWKVANALNLDISVLISGKAKKPELFTFIPASRLMNISYSNGTVQFKILTAPGIPDRMEMYFVRLDPGACHQSDPHASGSRECVMLTSGKIRIVSGSHSAELSAGDFLAYQSDLVHSIENIGSEPAELHMTGFIAEDQI